MDEVARKLSRRDSIKEIGFYSGKKVYFLLIKHNIDQEVNSTELVRQQRKLRLQLSFSPKEYKEGYY